jgi:hypothetical protein
LVELDPDRLTPIGTPTRVPPCLTGMSFDSTGFFGVYSSTNGPTLARFDATGARAAQPAPLPLQRLGLDPNLVLGDMTRTTETKPRVAVAFRPLVDVGDTNGYVALVDAASLSAATATVVKLLSRQSPVLLRSIVAPAAGLLATSDDQSDSVYFINLSGTVEREAVETMLTIDPNGDRLVAFGGSVFMLGTRTSQIYEFDISQAGLPSCSVVTAYETPSADPWSAVPWTAPNQLLIGWSDRVSEATSLSLFDVARGRFLPGQQVIDTKIGIGQIGTMVQDPARGAVFATLPWVGKVIRIDPHHP